MKKGSTLFLKFVILLIALLAATALLGFPHLEGRNANASLFAIYFTDPLLAYVYVASIPFFAALYQAFKLLGYIEKNKAFSQLSVNALKKIKYSAIILSAFGIAAMPFFIKAVESEDSPGFVLIGGIFVFACFVIATAAAVFQGLLQNAVDMKSENDLTV